MDQSAIYRVFRKSCVFSQFNATPPSPTSLLETFKVLSAMRVYSHSHWLVAFCTTKSSRVLARERWKKHNIQWTPCIFFTLVSNAISKGYKKYVLITTPPLYDVINSILFEEMYVLYFSNPDPLLCQQVQGINERRCEYDKGRRQKSGTFGWWGPFGGGSTFCFCFHSMQKPSKRVKTQ